MKIQLQQLCNSNEDIPIKFKILANEKEISSGTTTVRKLRNHPEIPMADMKKGAYAGILHLNDFKVIENPNFADYLRAGWQLSLSIAIDFTASNGQVKDPTSLHSLNDNN